MTRWEQLGTEDHQLQEKPKETKTTQPKGSGRGKGRGRGRGRGKHAEPEKEVENKGGDSGDMGKGDDMMQDDGKKQDDPMDAESDKISNADKISKAEGGEGDGQETPEAPAVKSKRGPALKRPASKTEKEGEKVKKPKKTAVAKAKAKAKAKTSKAKDIQMDESGCSPVSTPPVLDPKYQIESATWAGRWVPSCPLQHLRMAAIKKVFDGCIAEKVQRPSSFQSAFFKACSDSFKEQGMDETTPFDDFVSSAEKKVQNFLQQEHVRYLSLLKSPVFWNICFNNTSANPKMYPLREYLPFGYTWVYHDNFISQKIFPRSCNLGHPAQETSWSLVASPRKPSPRPDKIPDAALLIKWGRLDIGWYVGIYMVTLLLRSVGMYLSHLVPQPSWCWERISLNG